MQKPKPTQKQFTAKIEGGRVPLRLDGISKKQMEELQSWLGGISQQRVFEVALSALYTEERRKRKTKYELLTEDMSQKNQQAFLLCPMFINADSEDITTFIEEVWQKPVTDEIMRDVAERFRLWFKETYPTEYHDPEPPEHLKWKWEMP